MKFCIKAKMLTVAEILTARYGVTFIHGDKENKKYMTSWTYSTSNRNYIHNKGQHEDYAEDAMSHVLSKYMRQ